VLIRFQKFTRTEILIEWTLFVHNEGCREITTLFWLQIRCIELSNTVTENVVKCRTLRERGRMGPSRAEDNSASRARSRRRDELGRRTKEGAGLSKSRGKGCSVVTLSHNKMYLEGN
jgi:hypothetical protein